MQTPPFKIVPSVGATLRWTNPRTGSRGFTTMRATFCWGQMVDLIVTGCGEDFEMRLSSPGGRPWHKVGMTLDEARAYCAADKLRPNRLRNNERRRADLDRRRRVA